MVSAVRPSAGEALARASPARQRPVCRCRYSQPAVCADKGDYRPGSRTFSSGHPRVSLRVRSLWPTGHDPAGKRRRSGTHASREWWLVPSAPTTCCFGAPVGDVAGVWRPGGGDTWQRQTGTERTIGMRPRPRETGSPCLAQVRRTGRGGEVGTQPSLRRRLPALAIRSSCRSSVGREASSRTSVGRPDCSQLGSAT